MKKNILITLLSTIGLLFIFQSCSNSRTYADMLADERKAIHSYIKKNNIKVISHEKFEEDTITNLDENEYALLPGGVYMQIIRRGSENPVDTFAHRDQITTRFTEYNIIKDYMTSVSNTQASGYVDVFEYSITKDQVSGSFTTGAMLVVYGSNVPYGWLIALKYLRHDSQVKLIVPSSAGHSSSYQEVYPYVYEITRFDIAK